ncbi:MAG: molybdopterin-dependent oxidoreductase [Treponema sp.]|jgi:anaerobic dimethyl sulfoxide reductase subunit A|nr:molybdopterin-dependent oxidoreductase [Treponema sp.]
MKNTSFTKASILRAWRRCHDFTLFFEDFVRWFASRSNTYSPAHRDQFLLEYDTLFKGVNGDIHIPLWASVCKNNGFLLDATTLEVVKYYHPWGYTPAPADGNPPDFIGEQFRFLCYLYACGLHGLEKGDDPQKYIQGAQEFVAAYLRATAETVSAGIRRYGTSPVFLGVADRLAAFITDHPDPAVQETQDVPLPELYGYKAYLEGPAPAKQDKPERFLNTAGRNNCGGKCAIRVREQEGCILGIRAGCGLVGEPEMRACARGLSYRETYLDPRRLRYPMRRIGGRGEGRFCRISWEEAVDITAAEWTRIRDAYGPASRYVNYSTGVSAVIRPDALVKRLLCLDKGCLAYYNSYSSACVRFTTPFIYGDNFSGNSMEDLPNTQLLILWGHNPRETVFGSERNYQTRRKTPAFRHKAQKIRKDFLVDGLSYLSSL